MYATCRGQIAMIQTHEFFVSEPVIDEETGEPVVDEETGEVLAEDVVHYEYFMQFRPDGCCPDVILEDGCLKTKVISFEDTGRTETVYALDVEGDNSYTINNLSIINGSF